LIDSEPAAPTLAPVPVAPEVEADVKLSLPPFGRPAVTLMPPPVTFAPEAMSAVLLTSPTLMATAAPTPTPELLLLEPPVPLLLELEPCVTAVPSAVVDTVSIAVDATVTPPLALTVVFDAICAEVLVCVRLTATAAATSTVEEPLEEPLVFAVAALGVVPEPLERAPPPLAAASPELR
jgi:hypothetical protein